MALFGHMRVHGLWDIAVKRWLGILSRIVQKTKGVRFLVNYYLIPRRALGMVEWKASFAQALASELALLQTAGINKKAPMRLMTVQDRTRSCLDLLRASVILRSRGLSILAGLKQWLSILRPGVKKSCANVVSAFSAR